MTLPSRPYRDITNILCGLLLLVAASESQAQRIALVIGNSEYKNLGVDDDENEAGNATSDAKAVEKALKALEFKVAPPLLDANKTEMTEALKEFLKKLDQAGNGDALAVFYFSGYGLGDGRTNYLLPSEFDRKVGREGLAKWAIELPEELVCKRKGCPGSKVGPTKIIILDASKNDPLGEDHGLKQVPLDYLPQGTLMAFAAKPGKAAVPIDVKGDPNSTYTRHLVRELEKIRPNTDLVQFFEGLKAAVWRATAKKQTPRIFDKLAEGSKIFLAAAGSRQTTGAAGSEQSDWDRAVEANRLCQYKLFVAKYPNSTLKAKADDLIASFEHLRKEQLSMLALMPASTQKEMRRSVKKQHEVDDAWCDRLRTSSMRPSSRRGEYARASGYRTFVPRQPGSHALAPSARHAAHRAARRPKVVAGWPLGAAQWRKSGHVHFRHSMQVRRFGA